MKHQITLLTVVMSLLLCGLCIADITGDWLLQSDFNGNTFESILSISKNAEGKLGGYMINSFMTTEIKDVKLEGDKLTFSQQMRSMNGPSESTFSGTVTDDKIAGTLSSGMGDFSMSGKKAPAPAPVGKWQFTREFQGQEFVSTLSVTADEEGKLSAVMSSQRGDNEMSDVAFKDGKLTFKRAMEFNGNSFEMSYQFVAEGNKLKGTMTTQRGDREMEGVLVAPPVVGKWLLTVNSDFGEMAQMLLINPDMSARYGTSKIKKVTYNEDEKTISFKYSMSFGDQSFDNEFSGKIEKLEENKGYKLAGELNSSRGTSQVTGKTL